MTNGEKYKTAQERETVRDVCAEMNGNEFDEPHLNGDGIVGARILAKGWAKRILAAYEREMAAKDAEIARLKAALKPVLKPVLEFSLQNLQSNPMQTIREAQRIMKEVREDDPQDRRSTVERHEASET